MKHFRLTVDLKSNLMKPDSELEGMFTHRGGATSAEESRRKLANAYGAGYDVLPTCANPDKRGHCGCDETTKPCECGEEDFAKNAGYCGHCGRRIDRVTP